MFAIANVISEMGGTIDRASVTGRRLRFTVTFERPARVAAPKAVRVSKVDRDFVAELKKSGEWEKIVAEVRAKIGN